MIGVYQIRNIINDKVYIGSSNDIERRWNSHKSLLLNNRHHSPYLQNAWNKYGSINFIFEVIETLNDEIFLLDREQYYLDLLKTFVPQNGYNVAKFAESSARGRIITENIRKKISDSLKGEKNHNFGKKKSFETCQKMSNARKEKKYLVGEKNIKSKLKEEDVLEIRRRYIDEDLTRKQLASLYNVTETMVSFILSGRNWTSVSGGIHVKKGRRYRHDLPSRVKKLTEVQVLEIREKFATTQYTFESLAKMYNVNSTTISSIIKRKTWKHI